MNIVRVHDAGTDGSTHFIAAEFIQGRTLREYCSSSGLDAREAVRIVADLASAVFYAHRNNIVHRDIKPGNILMDANNQPHLTDFGLASQLDASALTANGTVVGTPVYMAPEQAAGRFGAALPACDQYSLGTVLYELLTGRPPFSGSNSVVLYHKLNSAPPAPHTIRADIPPEVEAICLKAMDRIPEKRFPDCEAMAAALYDWLAGKSQQPSKKRSRALPIAITAVAIALLCTAAALVYQYSQGQLNGSGPALATGGDSPSHTVATPQTPQQPSPAPPKTQVKNPGPVGAQIADSTQPPTPEDANFVDSAFYLPLNPSVSRKVVEFKEIHAANLDDTVAWLKGLGPNYFPSVLAHHVTAVPKQYHAIAYRLNLPVPYHIDLVRSIGEETKLINENDLTGYRAIAYVEHLHNSGPDGDFLRTCIQDVDYHWVSIGNYSNFDATMEDLRSRDFRPMLMIPHIARDSGQRLTLSICAHKKVNWKAAQLLTIESLKEFAEESKREKRFLFQIRGEQTADQGLRFYAIAYENPLDLDWDYQFDMSTAEYESELIRRKALGFRPTTVSSYGDAAAPKYAAAWVRYFTPPK